MIKFNCPACGKKIAVQDEHAGRKARCPGCKQIITIPAQAAQQDIPVAEPVQPTPAPPPPLRPQAPQQQPPPYQQRDAQQPPQPPPQYQTQPQGDYYQQSPTGGRVDLAMLAVLDAPLEDPIVFRWAEQELGRGQRLQHFQIIYMKKKKKKSVAQLLNLIALVGIGGIQRFYLGDIALGLAHLFTVGFCWVGTIVDIIAINKRVNRANARIAMQTLQLVQAMQV